MDSKIFHQEQTHIKDVISRVKDAKTYLENAINTISGANLEKLRDLRDNPETQGMDLLMQIEMLHQKNEAFNFKDKYKKLEEFEYLIKEPYFARLDLGKPDNIESFYIGKFGYTEQFPVVTDWRTKVASVYYRYRYPQKNIKYNTPDGDVVTDLTLKRSYEIDSGTLIKYYNNDIQLDENEIITEKIQGRTGGVLEDIIETIQESQLDIIESDPRQVCIVQGCVGSGKSTVAIHKLSHIFFNFPNLIRPERSILVAKNQILVGYLSTLFPKLGIFDINYKSLRDLVYSLIYTEEMNLLVDFNIDTETSNFKLSDLKALDEKLNQVHEIYEKKLLEIFINPDFEGFGGYKYTKTNAVYENLTEMIEDLEEELRLQNDYLKENPLSIRADKYKTNAKTLRQLISKIKKIRTELKESVFLDFVKQLGIKPNTSKLSYLQTLIYIFCYSRIIGINKTLKYEYCVVDEGQDFSVLEYLILGKLVINGRFCILGDLNQSYQIDGLSSWDEIKEVIKEAKQANVYELDTNYRSTKPIIDLANKILNPYTKNYLPKSINRRGSEPVVSYFDSHEAMSDEFKSQLNDDFKELNKSIGIICFDTIFFDTAFEALEKSSLKKEDLIVLDPAKKISYIPKGVYLTHFNDCKGLEFAKVYVLGLNLTKIKSTDTAKRAFVAVTRAMNEVSIYAVK